MSTSRRVRLALALAAVVLLTSAGAGLATIPGRPVVQSHSAKLVPAPSPSVGPAPATAVGDRTAARGEHLRGRLFEVLGQQAAAFLRGDESTFLGPARSEATRAGLSRRFRNLTAMRATVLRLFPNQLVLDEPSGHWRGYVLVSFCFVVPDCRADTVAEPMVWADTDSGPELVSVAPATAGTDSWYGSTQPWEVSDLHVAIGARTLVATTAALKGRLPVLLREAEKAAAVADTFATKSRKPDLYRIYLADKTEWQTWHQNESPNWMIGYATTIGDQHSDVVLNAAKVTGSYLDDVLRHELTHASTLPGMHTWEGNWWLIEGIADLATHPSGLPANEWAAETKSFIRRGWDKQLPREDPADDLSDKAVGVRYGVAFLAVKSLDSRFGRDKLLKFFERVVLDGASMTGASQEAFGQDWAQVEADTIADIRRFA